MESTTPQFAAPLQDSEESSVAATTAEGKNEKLISPLEVAASSIRAIFDKIVLDEPNETQKENIVDNPMWIPSLTAPYDIAPVVQYVPFQSTVLNLPKNILLSEYLNDNEWSDFLSDVSYLGRVNEKLDNCWSFGPFLPVCLFMPCLCCLFRDAESLPVKIFDKWNRKWKGYPLELYTFYRPGNKLLAFFYLDRVRAQQTFGFVLKAKVDIDHVNNILLSAKNESEQFALREYNENSLQMERIKKKVETPMLQGDQCVCF